MEHDTNKNEMRPKKRQTSLDKFGKNKFTIKMKKKLVALGFLVLLAFVGLVVRLVFLVRDNGDSYKKQVLSQREYASAVIPYKRGSIIDCNGTVLAASEKVYNVIIDSKAILVKEEYLEPTVSAVSSVFGVDAKELREYITSHPTSQYYVCKRKQSYDAMNAFEMLASGENGVNVKGVWFETEYQRSYPQGSLACDVIGFTTGMDGDGMYGLEQFYNDVLSGKNGREYGYLDEDLNLERTTVAAENGYTLVTTVDANIQSIVERHLKKFNDTYANAHREGLGAYNTGCIIMNPNSGEVLAMASYPNYDLNTPYDLSSVYTQEQIEEMTQEEYTTELNALWKNFCITSTFEPGSTGKPFTVATGLETGAMNGGETYYCPGYLTIGDYQIHCHNRLGDGQVGVEKAISSSCNVALMQMAQSIGKKNFLKYSKAFNFGLKTNIDLSGEARTESLVFNEKTMFETELATASFGQGYNVTMIQLISAYCSLINGGNYYQPHVVKQILNSDGAVVKNIEPRLLKQTISESTSDAVRAYCNAVVEDGTGKAAKPTGYTMGGKTGTAEMVPRNQGNYVVSFIGYVPADNPEVVIYVVVDRANQAKQDNSKLASVLVHDIMTEVLPYMGINMTEVVTDAEKEKVQESQTGYLYEEKEAAEREAAEREAAEREAAEREAAENGNGNNGTTQEQPKREVKIDPETGYAIDPLTHELLDPETGEAIDPNSSFMERINPEE
ncbi:MAG: cell division protein FtsI [Lachnospiraceae bacterium]|nr:cell division protein FtsI [Candidatus Merdinaster equi]